jgi:transposase
MRGEDERSEGFFSYVRLEERIAADHPLRAIRDLIDEALRKLSPAFTKLYAREGRPSIPPEQLLRALLLQAFYTVRSERQLMEQLNYNLLFRWFVGLSADDPVWDATVFCKNRDRQLNGDIEVHYHGAEPATGAHAVVERALLGRRHADRGLGQHEEFRAEGWQPSAVVRKWPRQRRWRWAQRRARFPWRETRECHAFLDDRSRRPIVSEKCRQGGQTRSHGHLMMENRNGLIVDARLTEAKGTAERTTALDMIDDNAKPGSTVGGDRIMTRSTSSPVVVNAAARHMSHRMTPTAARRSMDAQPAIPAMLLA